VNDWYFVVRAGEDDWVEYGPYESSLVALGMQAQMRILGHQPSGGPYQGSRTDQRRLAALYNGGNSRP